MSHKERSIREFSLYLWLFGAARIMAALWFTPQYSEFASFHYPFAALSDSGFYPFVHYWLEYPPLFPYLSVGVYRLFALFLEPQSAVHFKAYLLALQALMGLLDVANAALIYRLVARFAHVSHATFAALVFCLSFLASFVASGFFDGMALCFILLALAAFVDDRPVLAGIALGLGVVTKILPIVLLPAFVKFRKGAGSLTRMAISFVLTVGLLWGSFFLVDWELAAMPVRSNGVRPPWETVWALMEKQFQFGHLIPEPGREPMPEVPEAAIQAVEALKVETAGAASQVLKLRVLSRFSTDLSAFPKASNPMLHLFAGLLFLALFLLSWRTVRSREPYHVIPYSGFLLVLLLLCSKGWSPQFVVFPAAFILLCYPSPGGATAFLALMVVNFLEMPVWLSYVRNIEFWGPITLGGLVLARMALLLGLGWRLFWDTVPHE